MTGLANFRQICRRYAEGPAWLRVGLAVLLTLLAWFLTTPRDFGVSRTAALAGVEFREGYLFSAPLPKGFRKTSGRFFLGSDAPVLWENDRALPFPGSSDKKVSLGGYGRYDASGKTVVFSSSDNTSPLENGRSYRLVGSVFATPELILILLWLAVVASWGAVARRWPERVAVGLATAGTLVLLGALLFQGRRLADAFMQELWAPVLWAGLLAAWVVLGPRSWTARLALVVASVPAVASWIYYAVSASSHSSYLIAGVVPVSDANLHFIQAAEMVRQGWTGTGFNGRFLFPAYFSGLLEVLGCNLQIAGLAVALLALWALTASLWEVAARVGAVGTALYALVVWLYFRHNGCGIVMSEGLGLTMGLLSLTALLRGARLNSTVCWLLGLFCLGVGFAARPGALFVLPALCLYAGWIVWGAAPRRWVRVGAAVAAAIVVALAGLFSNTLAQKVLYRGAVAAYSNFAFSFYGMLTNSKWTKGMADSQGDPKAAMDASIALVKAEPQRLVYGALRAADETLVEGFLYQFGEETRLAHGLTLLAAVGVIGAAFFARSRADAGWILLGTLGLLASVPFAPPWDAAERPYAATVPFQALLAALGGRLVFQLLVEGVRGQVRPVEEFPTSVKGAALLAGVVLALTFVIPIGHELVAKEAKPSATVIFLPGSTLVLGPAEGSPYRAVSRADYLARLSRMAANRPAIAKTYALMPEGAAFGMDWATLEATAGSASKLPLVETDLVPDRGVRAEAGLLGP